ncbi:hypothetical protein [Streptomyces sp. enrichment culture]|uniref:hypothetical protein n=1 Tax=Streptomyces sp. enrichment culture TaxID=1795815 RepID=UPI003F55C036
MPHVAPAHLVELALGNNPSDGDAPALRHLARCGRCREELRRLTRVVAAARAVEEGDLPCPPPPRVWQRLLRDLASEDAAVPPPARPPRGVRAPRARPHQGGRSSAPRRPWARPAIGLLSCALVLWWYGRRAARRAGAGHLPRTRTLPPGRARRRRTPTPSVAADGAPARPPGRRPRPAWWRPAC